MTNHYHLLIETPEANLSSGMRQLGENVALQDLTPAFFIDCNRHFFFIARLGSGLALTHFFPLIALVQT